MDPTRPPFAPLNAPQSGAPRNSPDADGLARRVLGSEVELAFEAGVAPAQPEEMPSDSAAEGTSAAPEAAADEPSGGLTGGPIPRWTRPPLSAFRPPREARNPSLPTFVGLIMLILTFFIVLTSISINDRKKSDVALASLQDAFSGTMTTAERFEDQDMDTTARDFMQGLTGKIQSLIPLMGGRKASPSDHQVLWLPISLAFADAGTGLEPGFSPVLQELLNASEKIPPRIDYQVEVRLCAAAPSDTLRQRATALAVALAKLRAPLDNFAIGTQDCQADRIGFAVAMAPTAPLIAPAPASPPGNEPGSDP